MVYEMRLICFLFQLDPCTKCSTLTLMEIARDSDLPARRFIASSFIIYFFSQDLSLSPTSLIVDPFPVNSFVSSLACFQMLCFDIMLKDLFFNVFEINSRKMTWGWGEETFSFGGNKFY